MCPGDHGNSTKNKSNGDGSHNELFGKHCNKRTVGKNIATSDMCNTAESDHLEKHLLERYRRTLTHEREDIEREQTTTTVNWIRIGDFTVEVGKQQIWDYIQTWELKPCWLYSLDFLSTTDEEHHTFCHYRARFSTPTPQRPIQGTASVYFVVHWSKVKPLTLPIEVHFVIESHRLVHKAGAIVFREKWLLDVIENKALLQNDVKL